MHFTRDERQDRTTVFVHSEGLRRGAEADTLQVRQERVDGWRPNACATMDGIADPYARAEVPSTERLFHAIILRGREGV
jgi:hypothetical protein